MNCSCPRASANSSPAEAALVTEALWLVTSWRNSTTSKSLTNASANPTKTCATCSTGTMSFGFPAEASQPPRGRTRRALRAPRHLHPFVEACQSTQIDHTPPHGVSDF